MELAKGKKFRKELVSSALKLMKEQWDADLVTLRSCSDQVDPTVGGSLAGRIFSDLVVWLPREGRQWDKKLGFIRRFTRLLYPKDKRSVARSKYRRRVSIFREVLKSTRHLSYPTSTFQCVADSMTRNEDVARRYSPDKELTRRTIEEDDDIRQTPLFFQVSGDDSDRSNVRVSQGEESFQILLPSNGRIDTYFMNDPIIRKASGTFLNTYKTKSLVH
jgi:hypothetical protein